MSFANANDEKKNYKKEYLRNYYRENKEKWKKGNIYHPKSNKSDIKGFEKINKKIVVSFD